MFTFLIPKQMRELISETYKQFAFILVLLAEEFRLRPAKLQ